MSSASEQPITRRYTMTIRATPDRVFPMLCPVREHDYLDDWSAEILYSESGVAEQGCVFQTPNADGPPTTWYIVEHEPETGRIVFVTYTPESRVSRLDIAVESIDGGATSVTLTYTHTAIAPAGRVFIAAFSEGAFNAKMRNFDRRLNEHLSGA